MSRLPYFFLHTEARNDAKLRSLTAEQHRVWFRLLCYAAEQPERGVIEGTDWFTIAVEVADADEALLEETVAKLERLRIVVTTRDITRDTRDTTRDRRDTCDKSAQRQSSDTRHEPGEIVRIAFPSFAKRNPVYPSDSPDRTRERKAKSRAAKRCAESEESGHEMSRPMSRIVTSVTSVEEIRREEIRKENTPLSPPPTTPKPVTVRVTDPDPDDLPFVPPTDHPATLPMPGAGPLGAIGANSASDVARVMDECARLYPTEGVAHWARGWLADHSASRVIEAIHLAHDKQAAVPSRYIAGILRNPSRSPSKASVGTGTSNLPWITPEETERLMRALPML